MKRVIHQKIANTVQIKVHILTNAQQTFLLSYLSWLLFTVYFALFHTTLWQSIYAIIATSLRTFANYLTFMMMMVIVIFFELMSWSVQCYRCLSSHLPVHLHESDRRWRSPRALVPFLRFTHTETHYTPEVRCPCKSTPTPMKLNDESRVPHSVRHFRQRAPHVASITHHTMDSRPTSSGQ